MKYIHIYHLFFWSLTYAGLKNINVKRKLLCTCLVLSVANRQYIYILVEARNCPQFACKNNQLGVSVYYQFEISFPHSFAEKCNSKPRSSCFFFSVPPSAIPLFFPRTLTKRKKRKKKNYDLSQNTVVPSHTTVGDQATSLQSFYIDCYVYPLKTHNQNSIYLSTAHKHTEKVKRNDRTGCPTTTGPKEGKETTTSIY